MSNTLLYPSLGKNPGRETPFYYALCTHDVYYNLESIIFDLKGGEKIINLNL